jgi:antirestriction protein ArdC
MTTKHRADASGNDAPSRTDLYSRITGKIAADLERGVRPWHRPWNAGNMEGRITRPLRHNGIPYQGINVIMLWMAAVTNGYGAPHWFTFRQARELGGNVRKGEHGELVVYADRIIRTGTDDKGEETERSIPFLRGYTEFNAEQCENLPAQYSVKPDASLLPVAQRIKAADTFFAATGAEIHHGGNRAYYAEGADHIQMPPFETFRDAESYSATLAHECVHWTKHDKRLARDFGRTHWGDEGYAREELVAELGSAFLSADLGIAPEVRDDHASYIAAWLEVLKNETRFIFTAASHAQRAVDYLHGLQSASPARAIEEAAE